MVLDLMHAHIFHWGLVNDEVKPFLFLVHQVLLIIERKMSYSCWMFNRWVRDDTKITTKAKYSINITKSRKKTCLSLLYNSNNSFLYANGVKICQFKGKDSEIKPCPLYLRNNSTNYTVNNKQKDLDWIERCMIFPLIITRCWY